MDNICLKNIQLGIIPTKNIRLCRTQLHHRLSPKKERFLVPSILIILSYYYIICWNSGPQRHVSHLEIYHIIYMAVPSGTCDDKIKGGWIYIQWIPYRSLLSTNKHNVKKKKKKPFDCRKKWIQNTFVCGKLFIRDLDYGSYIFYLTKILYL